MVQDKKQRKRKFLDCQKRKSPRKRRRAIKIQKLNKSMKKTKKMKEWKLKMKITRIMKKNMESILKI